MPCSSMSSLVASRLSEKLPPKCVGYEYAWAGIFKKLFNLFNSPFINYKHRSHFLINKTRRNSLGSDRQTLKVQENTI